MADKRDKFEKILAVAINPGAYEDEAIAALRKARELVQTDPTLAHREPPAPPVISPPEASYAARITNIQSDWLNVVINSLSQEAYGLGLRSKITCDFSVLPYAVEVRCDGDRQACDKFKAHVAWVIEFVNKKVAEKK